MFNNLLLYFDILNEEAGMPVKWESKTYNSMLSLALFVFCTLIHLCFLIPIQARMQSAIVSGRLVCCATIVTDPMGNLNEEETPADICPNFFCPGVEGAVVQIIERDTVDPDDLLASFRSLPHGFFSGIGQEDEMFDVDVDLVVTHQCGAKPGCVRKTTVKVPSPIINSCAAFTIDPFDLFHPGYDTTEECS